MEIMGEGNWSSSPNMHKHFLKTKLVYFETIYHGQLIKFYIVKKDFFFNLIYIDVKVYGKVPREVVWWKKCHVNVQL